MFEGLSGGKCVGKWQHGSDYWNSDKIGSEAFAHFFSASVTNNQVKIKLLKNVFPEAYAKFLNMIGEMDDMKYEYKIPDFMKPDSNRREKPLSKLEQLIKEYEEKFPDQIPTEPTYPLADKEEMCRILEECIRENISFRELTGFEYEEDSDD